MGSFYDFLQLLEIAKFYNNNATYEKWINEIIQRGIQKAFRVADKPNSWRQYNLQYWKENLEELYKQVDALVWDHFTPGMEYQELLNFCVNAVGQIFQKGPYTRRHIAYAMSLGKHPGEVEKRKIGRQVGFSPGSMPLSPEQIEKRRVNREEKKKNQDWPQTTLRPEEIDYSVPILDLFNDISSNIDQIIARKAEIPKFQKRAEEAYERYRIFLKRKLESDTKPTAQEFTALAKLGRLLGK